MATVAAARLADFSPSDTIRSVCEHLESRIDKLEEQLMWEEELRKQNPALQDLYEKYQVTKRLIGND